MLPIPVHINNSDELKKTFIEALSIDMRFGQIQEASTIFEVS